LRPGGQLAILDIRYTGPLRIRAASNRVEGRIAL
jgi:hypothetical protein